MSELLLLITAVCIIAATVIGIITTPEDKKGCDPGPDCSTCPFPCEKRPN